MTTKLRRLREFLSVILISLCVAHIVQQVVVGNRAKDEAQQQTKAAASPIAKYEQTSFTLIAKLAHSSCEYLSRRAKNSKDFTEARKSLALGFSSLVEEAQPSNPLYEQRLLIATALGLEESKKKVCQEIPEEINFEHYCGKIGDAKAEVELASNLDPWFILLRQGLIEDDKLALEEAYAQSKKTTIKFITAASIGIFVLVLSCYLFFTIIGKAISGKLDFGYQPTPSIRLELIEAFALYISGMLFLPKLIRWLPEINSTAGMLFFNISGITSLSLIYFWPRIANAEAAQQAFGLAKITAKDFVKDFGAGPLCYVSFLSPLFLIIFFYSLVLQILGVDPSSGAHPIIPMLANDKNGNLWILAALVAVVVAPLVEELFFRGALYGWLRTRLGAAASIMISAMIFAVIHPQGALGLVPLTCIGMMLAFVREWRKSLVAPILAHACVNGVTLTLASSMM